MKPKLSKIAAFPNWKQKFSKPIPVQSSAPLFSLQHARDFIGALPETEQASASWRTAERLWPLSTAMILRSRALR